MTKPQPEPGQVWERDGERREVVLVTDKELLYEKMFRGVLVGRVRRLDLWDRWQSGAKLIEGGDGDA